MTAPQSYRELLYEVVISMTDHLSELTTAVGGAAAILEFLQADPDVSDAVRAKVDVALAELRTATAHVAELTGVGAAAAQSLHARIGDDVRDEGRSDGRP